MLETANDLYVQSTGTSKRIRRDDKIPNNQTTVEKEMPMK